MKTIIFMLLLCFLGWINSQAVQDCDVAILGSGPGGLVTANRIVSKFKVCIFEAGIESDTILQSVPALFSGNFRKADGTPNPFDWGLFTEEESDLNNRKMYLPRGNMTGGTSSMNAMVINRPANCTFNKWREDLPGWSHSDFWPLYKSLETNLDTSKNNVHHGVSGQWMTGPQTFTHEISKIGLQAHVDAGIPYDADHNDGSHTGVTYNHVNIVNGARHSPVMAFLNPIRGHANLTLVTSAVVDRIGFNGKKPKRVYVKKLDLATGTITDQVYNVRKAVVLAAGTYMTPAILQRSGIGNKDHLKSLRIDVVEENDDVGKNLQDHVLSGTFSGLVASDPQNKTLTLDVTLADASFQLDPLWNLQYSLGLWFTGQQSKSPASSNVPEVISYVMNGKFQTIQAPVAFIQHGWVPGLAYGEMRTLSLGCVSMTPKSKGSVKIQSKDPFVPPKIKHNYFKEEDDLDEMAQCLRLVRNILNQTVISQHITREYLPGPAVQSTADLKAYVRNNAQTMYHPTSSCRAGKKGDSCVNHNLKVHGVPDLYVADASAFPSSPDANPQFTIAAFGAKLANYLLATY